MKTLLLSFVYPGSVEYLGDFLAACSAQSDPDFDVLLINDGASGMGPKMLAHPKLRIQVEEASGSIAEIRAHGVQRALDLGYEALILADSDDWFDPGRVDVAKRKLRQAPVLANQLVLARSRAEILKPLWQGRMQEAEVIGAEFLRDKNCIGFSNSALLTASIGQAHAQIPPDILAYDWLFFARILAQGHRAVFTRETSTFYRQQSGNVAGLLEIDEEAITRGLRVKQRHYQCLAGEDKWFFNQARSFDQILQRVHSDLPFAHSYYAKMKAMVPADPMWWESTRLI